MLLSVRRVAKRHGRLPLLFGPLGTGAAAMFALAALLVISLAVPQSAWGELPGSWMRTGTETQTTGSGDSPFSGDAPAEHESPGEGDDDLEDERETELVVPAALTSVTGKAQSPIRSPARLMSPQGRVPDALEKPPRV